MQLARNLLLSENTYRLDLYSKANIACDNFTARENAACQKLIVRENASRLDLYAKENTACDNFTAIENAACQKLIAKRECFPFRSLCK